MLPPFSFMLHPLYSSLYLSLSLLFLDAGHDTRQHLENVRSSSFRYNIQPLLRRS